MDTGSPPPPTPPRAWVWHCSDASIAAGQISVLAVAETFAAVGLYWWLALHFDWPWLSLIGIIAAPMLLLRSPESVEMGVKMLRRSAEHMRRDPERWEVVLFNLIVALVSALVTYFVAVAWLPSHIR